MKHIVFAFFILFACFTPSFAAVNSADSIGNSTEKQNFAIYIYNKEYKVFIRLDAYKQNITIPGQEVFGEMPGYFSSDDSSLCWLITDVELSEDGNSAKLFLTNDYGSEDLEASLKLEKNGTYTLKQLKGSTLKIARKRKWVKIPSTLSFERLR